MKPPPRQRRGLFVAIIVALLLISGGVITGLVIVTRLETGEWQMPDPGQVVRIIKREPKTPARIIFLERKPIEILPGTDNSAKNTSSVLENVRVKAAPHTHANSDGHDHVHTSAATTAPKSTAPATPTVKKTGEATRVVSEGPAKLSGWKGSDKAWKQVVTCVQKLFAPFDVKVVDARPTTGEDFVLVAVGGKPAELGVTDQRVGGLAPFNGGVIGKPVVYAFASALNNDPKVTCETIGMEVAHAYGLDHGYLCSDVMTYLKPCGTKKFQDKDVRCGELEARDCEGGEPTQNSYRRLLQVLGPTKAPPPAPPAATAKKK
ncbi:MAG TPA: hypothetical protein VM513_32800 [Kofleriaceae bacterium]|jgi:hypothetical protein|nr:hypothetical protein [Kofleriaceae bacterium]